MGTFVDLSVATRDHARLSSRCTRSSLLKTGAMCPAPDGALPDRMWHRWLQPTSMASIRSSRAAVEPHSAMRTQAIILLFLALLLCSVSPNAKASGVEVCQLSGLVTAVIGTDSEATHFRLSVEDSRPVACLGFRSHDPDACAIYLNQELALALSAGEASALTVGDRVELVQTVVDMTAGSEPGSQRVIWRSVRECAERNED